MYITNKELQRGIKLFIISGIILTVFMIGCREQFMPEKTEFESNIVVDAMLTDQPGPYTVKLSKSSRIENPTFEPFTNCQVRIISEDNETEILTEITPGEYQTSTEGLRGEVGKAYKLIVDAPNGNVYESEWETIPEPVEIDSIYTKLKFKPIEDEFIQELPGYQFYLDTKKPKVDSVFFLWKINETFKFTSDFKIEYYYTYPGFRYREFEKKDSLFYCWKTQELKNFFVGTSQGLENSRITGQPLQFVGTETRRLQIRYSPLISQYSIDKDAYNYWDKIKNFIDEESFLISEQPHQIAANVVNINDPSELVLGHFTVASVTRKRGFFNKPDVDFYFDICASSKPNFSITALPRSSFPIYLYFNETTSSLETAGKECFDCRKKGGQLEKPEFWIDRFENNEY